ncbi:MAG TPA: peptide deformylase [Rhodospirillales bacterium]|jgi:peptide deformylase|nr:peptide deformylase [Rhodospirillales bacterium]
MAILKLARMGHPVLNRTADAIDDPTAPEIHRLIADMVDTLADASGVGLAAPQVHVPKRLVIFHISESRAREALDDEIEEGEFEEAEDEEDDGENGNGDAVPMTVLINPEIEALSEETFIGVEGCLSLPDMIGKVPRFRHIRYKALTPDGSTIEREVSGFHARVVQHECDHLDGILYPMRMEDLSTLGYVDEMGRSELPLSERIREGKKAADND